MKQLFFIGCILICISSHGQTLTYYNYSTSDGLPSSESYSIHQDKKGFMWFATDNGVVKFDGNELKTFHLKDGLTDPVVFGFQEDERGRIWFRSFSGRLSYFENDTVKHYRYNDKLDQIGKLALMDVVYIDSTEDVWFGVRNCFGKIDPAGNVTVDTLASAYDSALVYKKIGGKDLLLIAFRYEVTNLAIEDRFYPIRLSTPTYQNRVFCKVYWRNKLYVSIFNDVLEYDGSNVRTVYSSNEPIISLSVDKEDRLWVGSLKGGVRRYESEDFKAYWMPEFLEKLSVTSVCQSTDGSLWFSTLENGVFYLANLSIHNFKLPGTSPIKAVESTPGYIAVADKAANLHFYDLHDQKIFHSTSFQHISTLFADSKNQLWTSTHAEAFRFDSSLKLKKMFFGFAADFCEVGKSILAVGSQRFTKFDTESGVGEWKYIYEVYRTAVAHDSLIYLSLRIGLHVRNHDFELVEAPKEFANFKISKMISVNDSTIVIATMGNGFHIVNSRTWKSSAYDKDNNFIANNIYDLLKKDSLLWIATENGLAVTNISSLLKDKPDFNYLSRKSGLVSNTINFLADGKTSVWAFSENAFSVIPANFAKFANKHPTFFIKWISVNGEQYRAINHHSFSPGQNNLKMDFGFISFNNRNIFLRHRLAPDDPWTYTKEPSFLFSSLAPGNYNFEIQYSADNINWSTALAPINFEIKSPWWAKIYVYIAAFLVLAAAGYWYFRHQQSIYKQTHHYLRIINEHQQKLLQSEVVTLERERNRIAKELHDRVGTNLTAIKLTVNQLLKNSDHPQTNDIEDQFQIAIKEIKDIIYDLTPPSLERYGLYTGLKNYINKLNKTIPLNISLKTFGRELHNYEMNMMIFRVLQELLTNSVKHSHAKNINLHISAFEDIINIVYEDDGIGFRHDPEQSGLGLNNIESRIQSVNGSLKFESGSFGVSYMIDIPLVPNLNTN